LLVGGVLVVLGAGCEYDGWASVPGAQVRPENRAPFVTDAQWRLEVQLAIDEWEALLAPFGCETPFVMSVDAVGDHPVRLIANDDWTWTGADGVTFNDAPTQPAGPIEVRTGPDGEYAAVWWRRAVLLHELGHALGLGHSDPANGLGIMTPHRTTSIVKRDDVAAAACALGCGACGTTVDPYDG